MSLHRTRPEACLEGGGEMGALMRSIDWAETPLGAVETWPQSLRTTVSTCLGSRFPILVWWGRDFVKLYNDAYRPMLGVKHPGAMGRPGREVWPEIWDVIGPMLDGVLVEGRATWSENLMLPLVRHGYTEECYFTFSYSPIRDESGGVGGVFSAITETTTQVIAERRLRTLRELAAVAIELHGIDQACSALMETLSRYPSDTPFAAVYLLDGDGATARRCGTSGVDASSTLFPPLIAMDDEAAPWRLREAATLGRLEIAELPARFRDVPGGPWPEPATTAVVLPISHAGQIKPYGLLVAGVSPRRPLDDGYRGFFDLVAHQAASAIANATAYTAERQRAEALAAIDRAKTAFFSNVSHEFRTPLTLLLGPTEDALQDRADLPARHVERLQMIHRNALRLTKLVNTMLDFSRIEAGRIQASYELTDLAALTRDVASAFQPLVERAGLRFVVDAPTLAEAIYVDRDMWEKIVLNLLSNAFKFTFEGEIAVSVSSSSDGAQLVVRDTGTGIPADELPRIFERFHRVASARGRTHEGTGIGLAFVHELVRLHGGRVAVSSQVDVGTTFTISIPGGSAHLPADRVEVRRTAAGTALGAGAFVEEAGRWLGGASNDGPRVDPAPAGRVLVADDNADMREYVVRTLQPHYAVEAVADGAAALAAVRRSPPDVVVTDIMMPVLDGFGLLRELGADPSTRRIPTILVSARAGDESRSEGIEAGASDYLVKPFSPRELLARVSTQVNASRLRSLAELERTKLTQLFLNAPFAAAVLDGPDLRCILQNARHRELVGGRDLVGQPLLVGMPELRGQPTMTILEGVLATGEPHVLNEALIQIRRGDALEDRYFNLVYQPVRDLDGNTSGIIAAGHEVTESVKTRSALVAANRAKDEFLAMLGHELRNPLAPILTALDLLRLRDDGHVTREWVVIERQVQHMVRLVDDLMDVPRIAQGKIELRSTTVELPDVVAKAVEMVSPLLEQRRHRLELSVPSKGMTLRGDEGRLIQVVSNLLSNAGKYTPRGGSIDLSAWIDGGDVVIRVKDNGRGITPELLPRIFDMFVQEQRGLDRAVGGLGLGLTLVRSLVQLHGGTVTAHSDGPNKGSEFVVRLPLAARTAIVAPKAPAATAAQRPVVSMRVLVVDDNEAAAEALAELLRDVGHEVVVAYDGPQALAKAGRFCPTVAILDIGLPIMDGYELAQRLRAEGQHHGLHLLALSGYGQLHDRERSFDAGFAQHLVKPVDIDLLLEAIAGSATPAG